MEQITQDELKAHLMQTSEEFRRLAAEHSEYHHKLEEFEAKGHLTEEDEVEEHRLKKLKLHAKDTMLEMINRLKAQPVA